MRFGIALAVLVATGVLSARTQGQPAPTAGPGSMVTGIMIYGQVVAHGVPLTSGTWGTDYITVSHALGVGLSYAVVREGLPYADTKPVVACSSRAHGIDVLILRAAPHQKSPVIEWGDPSTLKAGDELAGYVRREFSPEPVKYKFLHINLIEWAKVGRDTWSPQWHNTMVAEGTSKPGFSGSPWTAGGNVYGLHKGTVRLPNGSTWYPVAETATRIQQCLKQVGYEHLIPTE